MKRFLSAALVLTLLGSSAAVAAPHGGFGGGRGGFGGGHYRHGGGGNGAALIAGGIGLFALGAILACVSSKQLGQLCTPSEPMRQNWGFS